MTKAWKAPNEIRDIVLLPGMDGTGELFAALVSVLRQKFEISVVSYPTDEQLDYAELENLVRARLPQRPFALLGESFSGPIAISIAASPPEHLSALILSCSFARNPHPLLTLLRPVAERFPVHRIPQGFINSMMLRSFRLPQGATDFPQALAKVSPGTLSSRIRAALRVDVSDKLARIRAPLLYLRGRRDLLLPMLSARRIKRFAPQTQIVEIDGPHLLLQAKPEESAEAIRAFLQNPAS